MSTHWPAPVADHPVRGRVTVPGSKSVTNRALLLAALSGGPATVIGAPPTRDTALMVDALRALGVPVDVAVGFVVLDFLVSLAITRVVAYALGVDA